MSALIVDPAIEYKFPRAPTQEAWDAMTPSQRRRVMDELPVSMTEEEYCLPEGVPHSQAKTEAVQALHRFYQRIGRSVFVAPDLTVYYPGERRFAPDVLAVMDVSPHPRMKWVVSAEGKGLDWVLEIHVAGDLHKDLERNAVWYAKLGIPEYFIFDRGRLRLYGYHFAAPGDSKYRPIVPQRGFYASRVLGLDLGLEGERLRFFTGEAAVPLPEEVIHRLETLVEAQTVRMEEAFRQAAEEQKRAEQSEAELARLRQELERLKRSL